MIAISIALISLAITLGLYLVYLGVRHHRGSLALAITHASLAIAGFAALMVYILNTLESYKLYNIVAFLFIMALIGGIVLFALREGKKPPAMFLVGLHALMGVIGLYLLVQGYLQY